MLDDPTPAPPLAPDFAPHPSGPEITSASVEGDWLTLRWADGLTKRFYGMFLLENEVTPGRVSAVTREREVEIDELPQSLVLQRAFVNGAGDLQVVWSDGSRSIFPGGWLYDLARMAWRPDADLPERVSWTTRDITEPPSFDGAAFLTHQAAMGPVLHAAWQHGLVRLRGLPVTKGIVRAVAERIGTIRNSNFGFTFSVETKPVPDSNAYRAVALDAHTDLASRETQPGFQLLHCQENTASGGESTMVDGFAVAEAIRADAPEIYKALTGLRWVFTNRHRDSDYRWSGPIVETDSAGDPIEIRNTGFLRFYPDMDDADVPRAYTALRRFSELCRDPLFRLETAFQPGDLVLFDNRRVLHGRNGFDRQSGVRRLEGCYLDRDELTSRLRILARHARSTQ